MSVTDVLLDLDDHERKHRESDRQDRAGRCRGRAFQHNCPAQGEARWPESAAPKRGGTPPTLPEIGAMARTGDAQALAVIGQAGEALGGLANVLGPDVIGGGVTALADLLAPPLRRGFEASALPGPAGTALTFSTLGALAAIIGAAQTAALFA